MKVIIGGVLLALGLACVAAGQEPPAASYTRIHGTYVALESTADRDPGANAGFVFAAVGERRMGEAELGDAAAPSPRTTPRESRSSDLRGPADDAGSTAATPPPR